MGSFLVPAWATVAWWSEFPAESPEWKRRLMDFRAMVREKGLPVVLMSHHEVIGIEFARPESVSTSRNFGDEITPDERTVCRYCGQRKDAYLEYLADIRAGRPAPSTWSGGMVRVVAPEFKSGLVDSPGSNWVMARCPHVAAWSSESVVSRSRFLKTGGEGR